MYNDVHVERSLQSGIEVTRRNDKQLRSSKIENKDAEFVFGSISPRGGVVGYIPHIGSGMDKPQKMVSYGLESPDQTQRDTNESDNNISSCSTLDIVNKVEQLSMQQLEMQVRELTHRLNQAEEQRSALQCQLDASNEDKEMCNQCIEMHCIIAELSKKLHSKLEHIIVEEQEEPEGSSEVSYQEASVYNSELNLTNPDAECQTVPINDFGVGYATESASIQSPERENVCQTKGSEKSDIKKPQEISSKGQVAALQEEVLFLKAQIALLQSEISHFNRISVQNIDTPVATDMERQYVKYYSSDLDANDSNCSLGQQLCLVHMEEEHTLNDLNMTGQKELLTPCKAISSPQKHGPAVAKMAERVKLRCVSKALADTDTISVMDLIKSELKNENSTEYQHGNFKEENNIAQNFKTNSKIPTQLENEQCLQRKVDHLKVRNTLLSLSLDECKEHAEYLYLLCGKYESSAVGLQVALNCSDRAIEAYDVMLALLECKLALINDKTLAADESRKAVESVARHLLNRLESEKDVCENSLGPWQNTFNMPDTTKESSPAWTNDDDNRLRYHVSKLKGRRTTIQNTIVSLESPFSDLYEKKRLALEKEKDLHQEKNEQYDLEMAVLMQELLNLRDENMQLKAKIDEVEQARQHANERINVLQLQMQLDSNMLFNLPCQQQLHSVAQEHRTSYSEADHAALTEQQLVEALTRETQLKGRIQSLIASVAASRKLSDEKYEQLYQNVRELQKSNHNLRQVLEQNKRKYQQNIHKLEQKIAGLVNTDSTFERDNIKDKSLTATTTPQLHQHTQQRHPQTIHVPETAL